MSLMAHAAAIAEGQLGLATRHQLIGRNVPPGTIDKALATGRLRTQAPAVYRIPGAPWSPEVSLLAAVLAAGPSAMASHVSAAWLWGLVEGCPPQHHASVERWHRRRIPSCLVHESRDLRKAIAGTVRGVPVTGVGRTILDCAALGLDPQPLIDEARRRHKISRTLIPSVITAHARPGRQGIRRLRGAIADDEMPHADFERLVCRWLLDNGVSGWELHHRLVVPGYGPAELDIAWPTDCVFLELEGADHRDRRLVHDRDTTRQNDIVITGWTPLRATYRQWLFDAPGLLRQIRAITRC